MGYHPEFTRRYVTVADVLRTLVRSRARIATVTICTFALVCVGFALFPRSYQSEAKLLLRLGRESVSLDSTASFGPTVAMQQTRQTEVNTTKEVLASRTLCELVVDHIGVDRILAGGDVVTTPASSSIMNQVKQTAKFLLRIPAVSRREVAITIIQDSIVIKSEEFSNIVSVAAIADSPQFAQEIVKSYCEHFVDEHVRLYHAASSLDFFQEQTARLAESLMDAREKLRDEKNRHTIGSIDGRRSALELQVGTVQGLIQNNAVEMVRCKTRLAKLRTQLSEQEPTVVAEVRSGVANPATDGMRQQFYALELEERALKQRYEEAHPKRIAISRQLEEARQIFERQGEQRTEELRKINEEHQKLSMQLHEAEANLAGHESAHEQLLVQLEELYQEMAKLNGYEAEIAKSQMIVDEMDRNYRIHSERLEHARVDQELAAHQITNVRIAQKPSLQERPVSPRAALTLGLGFIFACMTGISSGLMGLFMQAELIPMEDDDFDVDRRQ